MNLRTITSEIGAIQDYNPDVPEYREEIRGIVNEIIISLYAERKWKWAQKEIKLEVFGDVSLPVDATNASQVTLFNDFNGPVGSGAGSYYAYILCPTDDIPYWLSAGCVLSLLSGTDALTNDPLPAVPGDYWITHISDDVIPNKSRVWFQRMDKDFQRGHSIYERTPKIGDSNADITCTFKHRYITLPNDCVNVLALGIRESVGTSAQADLRPFDNEDKYLDEQWAQNMDIVGRPYNFIAESDYYVKPPLLEPTAIVTAGPAPVGLRAPFPGKYEVCYTFVQTQNVTIAGPGNNHSLVTWESGPSAISDSVIPDVAANDGVTIGGLQTTDIYDGLRKRVYVRTPVSNRFFSTNDYPSSHTATGVAFPMYPEMLTNASPLPEHGGTYQRLRLYPRQDADYILTLRYLSRPQRLIDDNDSHEIPSGTKYIVYRACEEIFTKHNNLLQAKVYQIKADKELLNLENRWLTEAAAVYIKSGFSLSTPNSRTQRKLSWTP